MEYKMVNKKPTTGEFIRLPQDSLSIKNKTAFFLFAWLVNHKDDFKMNEYFIKRGTGMDYRTFRKYLEILKSCGKIRFSTDTNSTDTNSMITKIEIVYVLTNKSKKPEEIKPEEKPEEIKQEEVSNASVPLALDTVVSDFNLGVGEYSEKELPW
jgi:hypothetical protein